MAWMDDPSESLRRERVRAWETYTSLRWLLHDIIRLLRRRGQRDEIARYVAVASRARCQWKATKQMADVAATRACTDEMERTLAWVSLVADNLRNIPKARKSDRKYVSLPAFL